MLAIIEALRPNQWIKNLSLFAAAILTGQLFNHRIFNASLLAFISFCVLSSSSYLVNDLLDIDKDRLHPVKKYRPLARGAISKNTSLFVALFLTILGLFIAFSINSAFFIIALVFIFMQYSYSLFIKKKALIDIVSIAFFFILRTYAGEIATGFHLPIWITLTVIFLALFIASGKRRSELYLSGKSTRKALEGYSKSLLNFYTTIFAVCTLISYAMFTFLAEKVSFDGIIHEFLLTNFPAALDRKWWMVTLMPVILGIMRYGQIIFEMQEGERPERVVATDIPLLGSVLLWGMMIITIIYVL
ncbi:MAG: UbiA prenyltransferase family protein [Candidatus Shapirobacteria bacterium]|nr:UbiA prenyltransferase family protein [Candidatus Shapirobacteria bacterium]